jgi:serine/threonine protein phosphatase 1
MMLDARNRKQDYMTTALWMGNGGAETMDSYPPGKGWIERVPDGHWQFLKDTVLEFWRGPYLFVHAGILPKGVRWNYDEDPRLWIREEFLNYQGDLGVRVVFGHTPQRSGRPLVTANKIGIDTGVAFGGPLTAVGLHEEGNAEPVFYQV